MISATTRLPLRSLKDFFQQSLRIDKGIFTCFVQKNSVGYPRFIVSISKRSIPLSTRRNKVKRTIYAQYAQLSDLKPLDIVIKVKSSAILNYEDSQVSTQLHELLNSAYSRLSISSGVSR